MKIRIASIGKDRSRWFQPAIEAYAERIGHFAQLSFVELGESKHSGARAKEEEATALLGLRQARDVLVSLDERGKMWSTSEWTAWLKDREMRGDSLLLVLGGDEGLHESVTAASQAVWSLSRLTLPHRMARLVAVEQLYRAFTLLRGIPYHKS